jgi:alkanesulfonate monooxygenase SsuD/methylene tetrahydromethanopterin reductase-like flavin-dependent oxidoreductase (luciferase family)
MLDEVSAIGESYFDMILSWDHLLYARDSPTLDAFSLLTSIAARTRSIRLGTCVTALTLRGVMLTAKLLSTLDVISNGRAILGVGAGWLKKEFELMHSWAPSKARVKETERGIEQLKSLLSSPNSKINADSKIQFPCIQNPHPPIWIGSKRPAMRAIASKLADGWIPTYLEPSKYLQYSDLIRHKLRSRRDISNFTFGCHYSARYAATKCTNYIEEIQKAGCNLIAFYPEGGPEKYLVDARRFANEVIPAFRSTI